jgi:hypothetical protein
MSTKLSRWLSLLVATCLLLQNASAVLAHGLAEPTAQTGAIVTPASITLNLAPGASHTFTLKVETAPTPIPKVDVLFLFDVTGSMTAVLEEAKQRGLHIMNTIRAKVQDSAFSVASFCDYPNTFSSSTGYAQPYGAKGDYPWQLDQDITTEIDLAQHAIEGLYVHNGEDTPEDYATALFESLLIGWRPATKHIIVLFGDAPAHDTSFYIPYGGKNFGPDPGPDGQVDNDDDPTLTSVVEQIKDRGIEIIPINSDRKRVGYTEAGFEYMANETGGQVYQLSEATSMTDAVIAGLTQATSLISKLWIAPEAGYESWVTYTPDSYVKVGGGESREFQVTITVPGDEKPGMYQFPLNVAGDMATIGGTLVTINVGGLSLEPAAIRQSKDDSIQHLSNPKFETEFLGARFTWPPDELPTWLPNLVVNFESEEQPVKTWLETLNWKKPSPSELLAIYSLALQEDALTKIMNSQAQTAHIGNKQVAHVVGLILSITKTVDWIEKLTSKHVVGLLVTKLRNFIVAKLMNLTTTFIVWMTDQLPPDPELEWYRSTITLISTYFQSELDNALRNKSHPEDFLKNLLEHVLVMPLDLVTHTIHVRRTHDLIPNGLEAAKQTALATFTQEQTEKQSNTEWEQVTSVVNEVQRKEQDLSDASRKIEAAQNAISVVSDITTLAATAASLTGLGAVPAQIGHGISLVLKVVDAGMSVGTGTVAYVSWWKDAKAASDVTTAAFSEAASFVPIPGTYTSIPTLGRWQQRYIASVETGYIALSSRSEISAHSRAQLTRLNTDASDYVNLLHQLADAVRANKPDQVQNLIEPLWQADTVLNASFLVARQPIFSAAHLVPETGDGEFEAAYSAFGRSAAAFDGEGANLYIYLLGWLDDPDNADNRQLLLSQIDTVAARTTDYQSAIEKTLPLVPDANTIPSVIIMGYELPAELSIGESANLVVSIVNPSTAQAQDTKITLATVTAGKDTQNITQTIGALNTNETRQLTFRFTPTAEKGTISLATSASNGIGAFQIIQYTASRGGGSAGLGIIFVIGVVAIGGVFVYVIQQRRKGGPVSKTSARAMLISPTGGSIAIMTNFAIGRGSACNLHLDDPAVSRQHARIRYATGAWFIQDLNSSGGTFVNGQRVQATRLNAGDQIQIGSSLFTFQVKNQ